MKLLLFTILCIVAATANARSVKPDTFIAGGQNSVNVPFYVYLEIFDFSNFTGPMYFGGGSLITNTFVLTVAQNVDGFNSWRAGLGSNQISTMQWRFSNQGIVYPDYDSDSLSHNIAIIRLSEPTPNNQQIAPVLFITYPAPFPQVEDDVIIYGFGFTSGVQDNQPTILQTANLTVTSQGDCVFQYPHLNTNAQISNHFCARNNQLPRINICAGDQGGPAFSPLINTLVGIQSFYRVEDCTEEHAQPAAFIRVAPYSNWINNVFQAEYGLGPEHTIQDHLHNLNNLIN